LAKAWNGHALRQHLLVKTMAMRRVTREARDIGGRSGEGIMTAT